MEPFTRTTAFAFAALAGLLALSACSSSTPTPTATEELPTATATATSTPTPEPTPFLPLDIDPKVGRQHNQTLLRVLSSGEHCLVNEQQTVDGITAHLYPAYVGEQGIVLTLLIEGVENGEYEMALPPETDVIGLEVNGEGPFAVKESSWSYDPVIWTLVFWPEPPIDLNAGDVDLSLHINLSLTNGDVARFGFNFAVPGELPCANG